MGLLIDIPLFFGTLQSIENWMLSSQNNGYYCFVHKDTKWQGFCLAWEKSQGSFQISIIVSIPSCWGNMDPRNTPSNINRGVACAHHSLHPQSRHNLTELLETLCSFRRPGHVFLDHCKESPPMSSWKQQKFFSYRSLKRRCPQGHISPGCRENPFLASFTFWCPPTLIGSCVHCSSLCFRGHMVSFSVSA